MQWSQTLAGLLRTGDGTIARQGFVYVIICQLLQESLIMQEGRRISLNHATVVSGLG